MPAQTHYRERQTAARLAAYAECLWTHTPSGVATRVLPDTCVDLVFSRATGLQLVGSMTRAFEVKPSREFVLGIRLRAGAARSLLGAPVRELRDQLVPFQSGRAIEQRLNDAKSSDGALRVLESALQPRHTLSPVQLALGHLAANSGCVRIDDVARSAGLSLRQFRRHCIEETGLTPKHLARIGRFRRACARIVTGRWINWADLAAECGCYDQAHLIHEFTEFSGLTPCAYQLARQPVA